MKTNTRRRLLRGASVLLTCTSLSACMGNWAEGGFEFNGPAVTTSPPPTGAVVDDVALAGPGSNTDRVVWSQALEDEEVTGPLEFRLVQAVRSTNFTQPARAVNATPITEAGATITTVIPENPDDEVEIRFTIKDPGMGVQDVVLEQSESSPQLMATLPDGRLVRVTLDQTDRNSASSGEALNWTGYGAWNVTSAASNVQTATYFVTGSETPDGNVPTTGTATFEGFVVGNVTLPDGQNLRSAALQGDAIITADFASGTITGAAPNITATPLGTVQIGMPATPGPEQAWNGLAFAGTMTTGINSFSGTTSVTSAPGNSYSLSSAADGFFSGLFYGPNASELGAVWNLADGVGAASGVLVGKQ